MRIINIVKIKDGVVDEIESFGVFEEQLVNDVVEVAEKAFLKAAKELGANIEDDEEYLLDEGSFETGFGSICISWSDI
jgi:hypothetical protein